MNKVSLKNYKTIIGFLELFFGFPILGGLLILKMNYIPLLILFCLHVYGIILSKKFNENYLGHSIGIVTNLLGFIPILGMMMHLISGAINLFEASKIRE